MNHLSLFSGIGGLDLAAEWAGFTTVAFVERDPYCQRVLAKRWPGVHIFSDVRAVAVADAHGGEPRPVGGDAGEVPGVPAEERGPKLGPDLLGGGGEPITLVSGGFPCQPHSVAGKRQASADDRDLWPEVARVLRAVRPRWFVGENVRGLLHSESGRFFGAVLGDLADLGYRVGWGVWGASDVGALHQRERVFIVAYAGGDGVEPERVAGIGAGAASSNQGDEAERQRLRIAANDGGEDVADPAGTRRPGPRGCDEGGPIRDQARRPQLAGRSEGMADTSRAGREECHPAALADGTGHGAWSADPGGGIWLAEPQVGRVADGIPGRVDRLRALGNAVVPQQAYPLFKAIAEIEGMK